jgi:hypothetical protein
MEARMATARGNPVEWDHLNEASRVKSFFVLNISLASFGFKGLTRAQVCIDGTAGCFAWPR